jgi:hypothetical protein
MAARSLPAYLPRLVLQCMAPAQRALEDKLGGLPWGLPASRWPACRTCGEPQTLLAQLRHAPPRLDLGKAGRSLLVFQCDHDPGGCQTWDWRSGANAVISLDAEDMTPGPTPPPTAATRVEIEVCATGWVRRAEGRDQATDRTKLGGHPFWIQQPEYSLLTRGWAWVGQLDNCYHFAAPAPSPDRVGCKVGRKRKDAYVYKKPKKTRPNAPPWVFVEDDGGWHCTGPNFGDAGLGYLFLRARRGKVEGRFSWQCH